jgi:hypothetical protein
MTAACPQGKVVDQTSNAVGVFSIMWQMSNPSHESHVEDSAVSSFVQQGKVMAVKYRYVLGAFI